MLETQQKNTGILKGTMSLNAESLKHKDSEDPNSVKILSDARFVANGITRKYTIDLETQKGVANDNYIVFTIEFIKLSQFDMHEELDLVTSIASHFCGVLKEAGFDMKREQTRIRPRLHGSGIKNGSTEDYWVIELFANLDGE